MPTTDRPLTSEERVGITRFIKLALKRIGADRAAAPDPDKLQELISQAIDIYRPQSEQRRRESLQDASVGLGSLWGQVICDQLGWTWVFLRKEDASEYYAVVSPNRSHAVLPLHLIRDLLIDPKRDQNSLKLYKEIKAGILPQSHDHGYCVLK